MHGVGASRAALQEGCSPVEVGAINLQVVPSLQEDRESTGAASGIRTRDIQLGKRVAEAGPSSVSLFGHHLQGLAQVLHIQMRVDLGCQLGVTVAHQPLHLHEASPVPC